MFIKVLTVLVVSGVFSFSLVAQETTEERIQRRIEFLKAYIQNQDKILALSEKVPQDYQDAGKAVSQYQSAVAGDPESLAINELHTASLFYAASMTGLSLATEFYQEVDLCNKTNDRYRLYRPLEKFKGDPGKTCDFDDTVKAKYPEIDLKSLCIMNNFHCDPAVADFASRRENVSAAAKKIAGRVPDDSFMYLLSAFSPDWINLSLQDIHYKCHPFYPKCTDEKCQFYKWPVQLTKDHDSACLKIQETADKQNILLKDTKKVYPVAQPFHPLIFNFQKAIGSSGYTLDNRFLSLIVKHQRKDMDYYFYSSLLRGANWLAVAETLFEKNRKVLEELEKKQNSHPVVKDFRKIRMRAFDKKISTQEALDRARFHFTIDDYVKNF